MQKILYGLPGEVKYCKRCVISNQRPCSVIEFKSKKENKKSSIEFNDVGICSACQFHDIKQSQIDWGSREKELKDLCDKYRSKDGSYDCLVPGSGGKDSRYVSHILKYKYKMNPLTITWAPHEYTDIGFKNMISWFDDGFSNYLITPNRKLHRYLTREAFLNLGHPFQPFILGQKAIGPQMAKQLGIKLVFYGETSAEYGANISETDTPHMTPDCYSIEHKNIYDEYFVAGKSINQHLSETDFIRSDFQIYLPLAKEQAHDIDFRYFGYYFNWDPQEIYYYTAKHTGFEPNTVRTEGSYSRYSSIDDKIDALHYYTTYLKFGLGRASYDASQEVRNGKITRNEAIKLIKKYDHEEPVMYLDEILDYLNIKKEDFFNHCEKLKSPHLWHKKGNESRLKKPIWGG